MTTAIITGENTLTSSFTGNIFEENLISRWVKFVDRTPATARTYFYSIKKFLGYLRANGIVEPSRDDLINYREGMTNAKLAPATIKLHLNAVKSFCQWLTIEGILSRDITLRVHAPEVKNEYHRRDALTVDESRNVLNTMSADNSEKSLRDKCIMSLMIGCGLRSCEICNLDVKSLTRKGGNINAMMKNIELFLHVK